MIFVVRNQSSKVSEEQLNRMIIALSGQMLDVADAWEMIPPRVVAHVSEVPAAELREHRLTIPIVVEDTAQGAEGELGDHSVDERGNPVGRVLVDVSEEEAKSTDPLVAVCPVLSHEMIETFLDPFASTWVDNGAGVLVALEGCDFDQGSTYDEDGCSVSNFALPEYFNPFAPPSKKTNFLGHAISPCAIAPGGYAIEIDQVGTARPVFGELVTAERKIKALTGRFGRRLRSKGSEASLRMHLDHARHEQARARAGAARTGDGA